MISFAKKIVQNFSDDCLVWNGTQGIPNPLLYVEVIFQNSKVNRRSELQCPSDNERV